MILLFILNQIFHLILKATILTIVIFLSQKFNINVIIYKIIVRVYIYVTVIFGVLKIFELFDIIYIYLLLNNRRNFLNEKSIKTKERYNFDSFSYNNSTKLLPRSNGTNVEVRNNIENIEDL